MFNYVFSICVQYVFESRQIWRYILERKRHKCQATRVKLQLTSRKKIPLHKLSTRSVAMDILPNEKVSKSRLIKVLGEYWNAKSVFADIFFSHNPGQKCGQIHVLSFLRTIIKSRIAIVVVCLSTTTLLTLSSPK